MKLSVMGNLRSRRFWGKEGLYSSRENPRGTGKAENRPPSFDIFQVTGGLENLTDL